MGQGCCNSCTSVPEPLQEAVLTQSEVSNQSGKYRRDAMVIHTQKVLRFKHACQLGDIGWVRVSFLRAELCKGSGLPRRQALPSHKALVCGAPPYGVQRWVISHPWLAKQHADLHGDHLREIVAKLDQGGAGENDLVFFDFWSMYQKNLQGEDDRSPEQKASFRATLRTLNNLYANDFCKVLVIASIPSSADRHPFTVYSDGAEALIEPNPTPYIQRGWCFFEFLTSLLFRTCVMEVLDGPSLDALRMLMHEFMHQKEAPFTHEEDCELCTEMLVDGILHPEQFSADRMRSLLESGHYRLLRVGYLRQVARHGSRLSRRQDLPPEALELPRTAAETFGARSIFSLSYGWESETHPDPSGFRVQEVVRKLDKLEADDSDLMFWDWASLFREPRSESEQQIWDEAKPYMNLWYGSSHCRTLVSTGQSESARGTPTYWELGWPRFELTMSAFSGNVIFDDSQICEKFVDAFFTFAIKDKKFTCGQEDRDLVSRLFTQLIYERAGIDQATA